MKKLFTWQVQLALILISLSLGFYYLDYFAMPKNTPDVSPGMNSA